MWVKRLNLYEQDSECLEYFSFYLKFYLGLNLFNFVQRFSCKIQGMITCNVCTISKHWSDLMDIIYKCLSGLRVNWIRTFYWQNIRRVESKIKQEKHFLALHSENVIQTNLTTQFLAYNRPFVKWKQSLFSCWILLCVFFILISYIWEIDLKSNFKKRTELLMLSIWKSAKKKMECFCFFH